MPRRIITEEDARILAAAARPLVAGQPPQTPSADDFLTKLIKYIPSEVVTGWVALGGALAAISVTDLVYWLFFALFLLVLTPGYYWKQNQYPGLKTSIKVQVAASTGAFFVWVFALGRPFSFYSWYNPGYGAVAIIVGTLVLGLLASGKASTPPQKG